MHSLCCSRKRLRHRWSSPPEAQLVRENSLESGKLFERWGSADRFLGIISEPKHCNSFLRECEESLRKQWDFFDQSRRLGPAPTRLLAIMRLLFSMHGCTPQWNKLGFLDGFPKLRVILLVRQRFSNPGGRKLFKSTRFRWTYTPDPPFIGKLF